ncbi:MAG: dethiobiotin synthase [Oscillospiraceae bacterium]
MSKNLFVVGTGTDVGKTFVTGLILKKLRDLGKNAAYYKAAMSGNNRRPDGSLIPGDALFVKTVSGICEPLSEMCPYVYETAVSPHLASRLEGNTPRLPVIEEGFFALSRYEYLTMEGSGGILCPLSMDDSPLWLEDVIQALHLPCVLVADGGLGTINGVVLTVAYMREKNIPLKGIIFNRFQRGNVLHEDNLEVCRKMTGLPVLACVQERDMELSISPELLLSLYE